MKSEIKDALLKINFVERYETMAKIFRSKVSYDDSKDVPVEVAKKVINGLGYEVSYNKKERFFKVDAVKKKREYRIWFNIVLRSGIAEFIWVVYHHNEVRLGSPWGSYPKYLVSQDKIIKPPRYSNALNLEELLKSAFEMYEDFKQAIIDKYESDSQSVS